MGQSPLHKCCTKCVAVSFCSGVVSCMMGGNSICQVSDYCDKLGVVFHHMHQLPHAEGQVLKHAAHTIVVSNVWRSRMFCLRCTNVQGYIQVVNMPASRVFCSVCPPCSGARILASMHTITTTGGNCTVSVCCSSPAAFSCTLQQTAELIPPAARACVQP